jgi:two-component system, NtrC family, sensor kinase
MKILIVEDDRIARLILRTELEQGGHEVVDAAHGRDALDLLVDSEISLVIADWMMPEMDGLDLCRHIRSRTWDRYVYFIMLTAKGESEHIATALAAGADDFVHKPFDRIILHARIEAAERVIGLERQLAGRVDELETERARAEHLLESIPHFLIGIDADDTVIEWRGGAETAWGTSAGDAIGRPLTECIRQCDIEAVVAGAAQCRGTALPVSLDLVKFTRLDGTAGLLTIHMYQMGTVNRDNLLLLGQDVTEQNSLETQLAQAQKLESIGQLAAGIAHEINTPIQYIGDNVRFFRDSFDECVKLFSKYAALSSAVKQGAPETAQKLVVQIEELIEDIDAGYLIEETPQALDQTLEGVAQVATTVRAMKAFSHPGTKEKAATDINAAIQSTIIVTRNEWKYIAEMETHLDPDVPAIPCLRAELNQVILNLIVNATHAIADAADGKSGVSGIITVTTRWDDAWIEIRIGDTGTGIPDEVQPHIFEPFFTTKDVGKGTGQGLSIAHRIVVEEHSGRIEVESEVGQGTTFVIRLPVEPPE